jgi:hypothetical protein
MYALHKKYAFPGLAAAVSFQGKGCVEECAKSSKQENL